MIASPALTPVTGGALAHLNPYIGPRPFETSEKDRFFGRENEANDLIPLVIAERVVLLYSESGAGKSSLINARLIPGLTERNFKVLIGRVGGQTVEEVKTKNIFIYNLLLSLEHAIGHAAPPEPTRLANMTLAQYLADLDVEPTLAGAAQNGAAITGKMLIDAPQIIGGVQPLALIIDQFEEIFNTHPEQWKKRAEFFDQLRQAQEADPYLWVVLSIREDYIARLDPYLHLLYGGDCARFHLQRMEYNAALEAVKNPVRAMHPFDPGVAEELVNNLRRLPVAERPDTVPGILLGQYVEPVQLQVVCYQLWEQLKDKEEGSTITQEDLNRLARGGDLAQFISGALADFYEQAIATVIQALRDSPEREQVTERKLRDWFSTRLITEAETCNLVFKGEESTGGMPNHAVQLLEEQFIIRTENRVSGTWYELSHDRFIAPILQANRVWNEENPRPILADTDAWIQSGKNPVKLYEGRQLQAALNLLDDPQAELSEQTREFIRASQLAASQRQMRRNRGLFFAAAALIAVLTGLTIFSLYQMAVAGENALNAQKQQRTAIAASGQEVQQRQTAVAASIKEAVQRRTAEAASIQEAQQRQAAEFAAATAEAASAMAEQQAMAANTARATAQAANLQSQASRLSSLSDYFRETKLDLSLLLAVHAVKMNNSLESRRALLNSIQSGMTNRITRVGFPWYTATRPYSITFSPDGSQVAVGAMGHIYLWNTASGELVSDLPNDFVADFSMFSMAFDSTGSLLARAGGDGKVKIWTLRASSGASSGAGSVQTFRPFLQKYSSILAVAFQPGGDLLAVGTDIHPNTEKGQVYLYNDKQDKIEAVYDCEEDPCVGVAWSPDGHRLAMASQSGLLQVIDVTSNKNLLTVPRAHNGQINGLAWYPDGRRLVTSGLDRRFIQWDIDGQKILRQTSLPDNSVPLSLALSPDGQFLLAGLIDRGNWFGLWDGETLQRLDFKASGHTSMVTAVAFNAKSNRFATAGYDNTVVLWDVKRIDSLSTSLSSLAGPQVEGVGVDPLGRLVFAQYIGDGLLNILTEGAGPDSSVALNLSLKSVHNSLSFVPIQKKLGVALGGANGQVSFIDTTSGASLRDPVMSAGGSVRGIAVSEDGRLLAAVSCNPSGFCEKLVLRDLKSGDLIPLKGDLGILQSNTITSLAFSPSAKTLAMGTTTGKIILYDIQTGETRQAVTEGLNLQNITVPVTSLVYSSEEQDLLIAGFKDGRIALWDAATLGPLGEFVDRLNGEVTGLLPRKNADSGLWTLAAVSGQGEVREWDIDTSAWIDHACQMAGRDLTQEEKDKFLLPGSAQGAICPVKK